MPSLPQWKLIPRSLRVEKTARWAANAVKDIYSMLNVEIKNHDVSHGSNSTSATPTFYEITDIDTGITGRSSVDGVVDQGYREGDQIRLKSINVKGVVFNDASSTQVSTLQLLLVKHYDNFLGDAVSYDDIYDSATGSNFHTKLRNVDHKGQYKILKSRLITITPRTTEDDGAQMPFNMYINYGKKRKGTHVSWNGPAGNDPSNGKIYLMVLGDTGTNPPSIQFSSRVTYVDN